MTLLDRLTANGPKRILTLDGGGIRGAISVGILERIEIILRERHGNPNLRLYEYFDLIGGTSTGSIIAALLSVGAEVAEIKRMYLNLGQVVFSQKRQWWMLWKLGRRLQATYDAEPLQILLDQHFGEMKLGDQDNIKTGLCVVVKRADTGSTWLLFNHPNGKYYGDNQHILVRDAVRASVAAPVLFVPEVLQVGQGQEAVFVDGGVSMANNPSLQMFLVATLKGFPFHWPIGEDRLLLVSVGTGVFARQEDPQGVAKGKLWEWVTRVPSMLMEDADWQNQLLLQYLSRTPTPWNIDSEVGDLASDLLTPEPALSYLRYSCWLGDQSLRELGLPDLAPKADSFRDISDAANRYDFIRIGEAVAEQQVRAEHFPEPFDLR